MVERLLAISGEDTITVNRKYRDQWTGKLPSRFLVISNELPQLGDASGTIANRFVVLLLRESWLGREDHGLEDRLTAELTGILNWALDGLDRLVAQDRFTRPASTDEAILALQDLASPVAAFVREQCVTGPTYEVAIDASSRPGRRGPRPTADKAGNRPDVRSEPARRRARYCASARPRDGDDRESASIAGSASAIKYSPHWRGPRTIADQTPKRVSGARGPQWSAVQPIVTGTQKKPRGMTVSEEMAQIFEAKTSTCGECGQGIVWHPDRSAWAHAAPSDHAPELIGGMS